MLAPISCLPDTMRAHPKHRRPHGRTKGALNHLTRDLLDAVAVRMAEDADRPLEEALALVAEQHDADLAVRLAALRALGGALYGKFQIGRLQERLAERSA